MEIRHLGDCPKVIPQIAGWLFDEWGRFVPGASVERGVARLGERIHKDRIPLTLVAMDGEAVIGTVSVIDCDMETRPDLSPWLASLFVAPEHRRLGIGSALMEAAVQETKRLGTETLFLFTNTSEALYVKRGWEKMDACNYGSRDVVIMKRSIA